MGSSVSNGYDAGSDKTASKSAEKGNFSIKKEASVSITAASTESTSVNNKYAFNLSLASFSIAASISDSTNLGASVSVAYGIPQTLTTFLTPPKAAAKLKDLSTKLCLGYKYTDTINHRGESLSLRTNRAGIDAAIPLSEYGSLPVTMAGGERIDICASADDSAAAKSSLNKLKAAMAAAATAQALLLAEGATLTFGDTGSSGFRGNATDSLGTSMLISAGAFALTLVPMIAMFRAGSGSSAFNRDNLRGPTGCGTPNDGGILMDTCNSATDGNSGKITVNGQKITFKGGNSSLYFDNGDSSITMKGLNTSLETSADEAGGLFLTGNSLVVKAEQNAQITLGAASLEMKNGEHSMKITDAGVTADSLVIASGGVSALNTTFTNGIVSIG